MDHLTLDNITVQFGGLTAVDSVGFELGRGERVALLGPNGAGKTTLFNVIAGDIVPTTGRVTIAGVDCTHLPSRVRPSLGVARTYQRTRLMTRLTVRENLYLAQLGQSGKRHRALRRRNQDGEFLDRAGDTARSVSLGSSIDTLVGELSHGLQRQLEIGLAIVTQPELIMLDEPASGLSQGERERLIELLGGLPASMTMLLIEHDMDVALTVAERVVMLANGHLAATGTTAEIRDNPIVQALYLGTSEIDA